MIGYRVGGHRAPQAIPTRRKAAVRFYGARDREKVRPGSLFFPREPLSTLAIVLLV